MAISKVVYKSSANATPVTWMDATTATAAAADITSPKTAMLANGVVTQGTGSSGGITAATGEVTLASDFALSATPAEFPLQLSFIPDLFILAMTNASWSALNAPVGGLYEIMMIKKAYTPPYRISASASTDSLTNNYYSILSTATTTTTDSATTNGYNLNGSSPVADTYQQRFYFDNDGKLYVGRYSTAGTYMYAGTYRYFAIKV